MTPHFVDFDGIRHRCVQLYCLISSPCPQPREDDPLDDPLVETFVYLYRYNLSNLLLELATRARVLDDILRNGDYALAARRYDDVVARFVTGGKGELKLRECLNKIIHAGGISLVAPGIEDVDRVFDGLSEEIENLFNGWIPHLRTDTYLSCFSEHDEREDAFGRLSMWRAYGPITGVALVLNSAPFLSPSTALKAYASPVAYLSNKDFEKIFSRVTAAIDENADFLRLQGRAMLVNVVFNMLRFAALCTKHPGFEEEREWRVLYCPALESSKHVLKDIKVINGTPQPIYRIPLRDIPDEGLKGVEIPALLNRIIIGPTKYPLAMWKAFDGLLAEAGVENSASKVFTSDIPLRT